MAPPLVKLAPARPDPRNATRPGPETSPGRTPAATIYAAGGGRRNGVVTRFYGSRPSHTSRRRCDPWVFFEGVQLVAPGTEWMRQGDHVQGNDSSLRHPLHTRQSPRPRGRCSSARNRASRESAHPPLDILSPRPRSSQERAVVSEFAGPMRCAFTRESTSGAREVIVRTLVRRAQVELPSAAHPIHLPVACAAGALRPVLGCR